MNKKIRVLVIDDSDLFGEVLTRGLSSDAKVEVVARAKDPFEARDMILKFKPDVVTCDVEMPKMNGIEFVRRLMPQYPIPVIIVSSVTNAVFDAMNAGAVDFVSKPDFHSPDAVRDFILSLIKKIKEVSGAKIEKKAEVFEKVSVNMKTDDSKLIAIGASTGGTQALSKVILNLPYNMPGIVIVQHIPPKFSQMFAERLNNQSHFEISEAKDGEYVMGNHVYIAPGDKHMKIRKIGDKYKIELSAEGRVNGHCPSVDVLFESVAKYCGSDAIGVILTGMGYDGAKGLLKMKKTGAKTLGQNEATSVVYGMPKVAFEVGAVDLQLPLQKIPSTLCTLLRR